MNLILLLTALFSALTGVGGVGVRRPEVAQAVVQAATAEVVTAMPSTVARPLCLLPSLARIAVATEWPEPSSARGVPLWAGRRRE